MGPLGKVEGLSAVRLVTAADHPPRRVARVCSERCMSRNKSLMLRLEILELVIVAVEFRLS